MTNLIILSPKGTQKKLQSTLQIYKQLLNEARDDSEGMEFLFHNNVYTLKKEQKPYNSGLFSDLFWVQEENIGLNHIISTLPVSVSNSTSRLATQMILNFAHKIAIILDFNDWERQNEGNIEFATHIVY